ncbi:MAG: phage tail family protein [Candidatus Methanoperedenaceae archaeon]|nr:phage tail family protein [Candidatus Methanoperedenaceae archaeon]
MNGINLAQFTYSITDSQEPETGTIPNMGDENRQFAEDDRGLRTIIWEGYVSNDDTYLNLRKALFDNTVKVLKLHPERKITLLSPGFKKRLDVKKPKDSKMTIAMLAADTREYSTVRASATVAVTSSPADIQLTSEGSAPTAPEWTLTAIGAIINPAISNGADRMEWNGTLDPGDVMVVSKDGAVSVNGSRSGSISGTVPEADAGRNTFVYSDDPGSSHNCAIEVMWNDAYY